MTILTPSQWDLKTLDRLPDTIGPSEQKASQWMIFPIRFQRTWNC